VAFVIAARSTGEAARAALSAQIIAECKAKLADFKVPRTVFVVDEYAALDAREDPQDRAAQAATGHGVTRTSARNVNCSNFAVAQLIVGTRHDLLWPFGRKSESSSTQSNN
jgi:hypothetical protein